MSIIDLLRMSLESLFKRKVRTILTIMGVVIGTTSIVVMISLGIGMKSARTRNFEAGILTDEPDLVEGDDEYPSITYDEAEGKVTTCYTFDTRDVPQIISQGLSKGIKVKVFYEGDLSDMGTIKALGVTDENVK